VTRIQLIGGPWHGQTIDCPVDPPRTIEATDDDGRHWFYKAPTDPEPGTRRYWLNSLTHWKRDTWVVLGDDGSTPPTPYRTPITQGGEL